MDWASLPEWARDLERLRLDLIARLLLAAVLGGMIGLEREASGKPAGFRTNLLICVGAALLTDLSISIARAAGAAYFVADPGRIAAQIVSGIGFLGAGTIIQARGSVVGLTTAATLWVVAAIGMAVGAGAYAEAIGTALLVMLALVFLGRIEDHVVRRRRERKVQVTLAPEPARIEEVAAAIGTEGFTVELIEVEKRAESHLAVFRVIGPEETWLRVMERLLGRDGVRRIAEI